MDNDPYHWSVLQVVQFFKDHAIKLLSDRPNSQLPELSPLIECLLSNEVNGATLLENVDNYTLQHDFSINKLGTRGALIFVIKKLRSLSISYKANNDSSALLSPRSPIVHSQSIALIPWATSNPPSVSETVVLSQVPGNNFSDSADAPRKTLLRDDEVHDLDAHGRKRRRLILSVPNLQNKSRAGDPELGTKSSCNGFLDDTAIPLDTNFFGHTKIGSVLSTEAVDPDIFTPNIDSPSATLEDNFQFYQPRIAKGRALVTYKQMRYFLGALEPIHLTRNGRCALGVLPYPRAVQGKACSAIVFQFHGVSTEPVAIRELASHFNSRSNLVDNLYDTGPDFVFDDDIAEQVEYFNDKFGNGEDVILSDSSALLSSPDDESSDDESSEKATVVRTNSISVADKTRIIKDCINKFTEHWYERLPNLEAREARKIWKQAHRRCDTRDTRVQGSRKRIDELTQRIEKLTEEIRSVEWQGEKTLVRSCESLEPTVSEIERQKWMIDVWMRKHEPGHIAQKPKHNKSHSNRKTLRPVVPYKLQNPTHSVKKSLEPSSQLASPNDQLLVSTPKRGFSEGFSDGVSETEKLDVDQTMYEADDEEQLGIIDNNMEPNGYDYTPNVTNGPTTLPHDPVNRQPSGLFGGSDLSREIVLINDKQESDSEQLPDASSFMPSRSIGKSTASPSDHHVIDLTQISDSSTVYPSTKLNKGAAKARPRAFQNQPTNVPWSVVASWSVGELLRDDNKESILIKLLFHAGAECRRRVHNTIHQSIPEFERLLMTTIGHLMSDENRMILQDENEQDLIRCAKMYIAWMMSSVKIMEWVIASDASTVIPPSCEIQWNFVQDARQLSLFTSMLNKVLWLRLQLDRTINTKTSSRKVIAVSSSEGYSTSTDQVSQKSQLTPSKSGKRPAQNADTGQNATPHKKRKREVRASAFGNKSREHALDRQERYKKSIAPQSGTGNSVALISQGNGATFGTDINPARAHDEMPIYISSKLASAMKPYQIDGVRFLWREVTTSDLSEGGQGCVLAHTMGLGKTMQTLALLATLDETAESQDPRVYGQLPENLQAQDIGRIRRLRTLIICPPALIQNWRKEIAQWVTEGLWSIYSLEASSKKHMYDLETWMETGGILLVGYGMFRSFIHLGKGKEIKAMTSVPNAEAEAMKDMLTNGPELVVADEAQHLKNQDSGIGKAASCLKTTMRIALTGTPISNNLQEIYSIVSWIAPGYLGTPLEFRAHFSEPIAEGLYEDSTYAEKRKSIMKLKVLHHNIEPKVNRATIEVLRGSLQPKLEFVITVPLTACQRTLYNRFIDSILCGGRHQPKVSQMKIFGWLAWLTLLTNHPYCFRTRLLQEQKKFTADSIRQSTTGYHTPTTDVDSSFTPTQNNDNINAVEAVFQDTNLVELEIDAFKTSQILTDVFDTDDPDPSFSAKMTVFIHLLAYCLGCDDKVLIFSSSIPTLDYLSKTLELKKLPFGRIDGSTMMEKRTELLEGFQVGRFDIMLVSTKAGGVGLNMTAANRVFIFDFGFNPASEEQAIGRSYRLGQTKPVYVYRFVAGGTFEATLYNTQLFKSSLAQRVVDKKNPRRTAEKHKLHWLDKPGPVQQSDLGKWAKADEHVLGRLLERHGPGQPGKMDTMIRNIVTTETLQQEAVDVPLDRAEQQEVDQEIAQGRGRRATRRTPASSSHFERAPASVSFP